MVFRLVKNNFLETCCKDDGFKEIRFILDIKIWVLGQADHVLEFMLHKWRQNESELGKTMPSSLSDRIEQHRKAKVFGLIRFHSGEELSNSINSYPSRAEIIKFSRDKGSSKKSISQTRAPRSVGFLHFALHFCIALQMS